jgi:pre-mRNA cleavage complex 2 protein Pcf11
MNAYTQVDTPTRRLLETMLQTWKQPIPGSGSISPVFASDVTRPIDNALLKARTATIEAQQKLEKSQKQMMDRVRGGSSQGGTPPVPYRNTPSPSVASSRYPPPPQSQQHIRPPTNGNIPLQSFDGNQVRLSSESGHLVGQTNAVWKQHPISQQYPGPTHSPLPQQGLHGQNVPPHGPASLDTLLNDIANLIAATRTEFAASPYDRGVQARLQALFDLQTILQTKQLPASDLESIKKQVSALSSVTPKPSAPVPLLASTPVPIPPQNAQQAPSIASLFGPNALASLLGHSNSPTPPIPAYSTPPTNYATPVPPISHVVPPPPSFPGGGSLLASLQAAGLLPPAPNPGYSGGPPIPPTLPFSFPPGPPPNMNTPPIQPPPAAHSDFSPVIDIPLTTQSLKA